MRCNKIVVANSRNLWLVVFSRQHQKQSIYSIIKAIRKKTPCSRRNTILIGVKKRKIYIVDFLWIQIITEEILCKYFFNGHSKHTRNNMKRHCPHIYLYVYKRLLLNMDMYSSPKLDTSNMHVEQNISIRIGLSKGVFSRISTFTKRISPTW